MGSITLHLLLKTWLLLLLDLVKKLEVRQCAVPGGFLLSPGWLLLTQTCLCQVISEEVPKGQRKRVRMMGPCGVHQHASWEKQDLSAQCFFPALKLVASSHLPVLLVAWHPYKSKNRLFFFLIEATSLNIGALGRGCGEGARTRAGV